MYVSTAARCTLLLCVRCGEALAFVTVYAPSSLHVYPAPVRALW